MRLISSDLALDASLALAAAERLTLSQVARATGAPVSAAQKALQILVEDGIAERLGAGGRSYRLASGEVARQVVGLAIVAVPLARAVTIAAHANPSVELVAREDDRLLVVFSAGSTALAQARAAGYLERLAAANGLEVAYRDHDDVRRDLLADPGLRERMARAEILHGELDRTFPDRTGHGLARGDLLHRAHRSLKLPSPVAARTLAKKHGLASLRLFGSAVRSDFRSDSDVDVVVRYRPGVRPTLRSLMELERALEAAFERDVDVVREETLTPEARHRIEREAVPLA